MGDRDAAKVFVGALSWDTTDGALKDAFQRFGDVVEARVRARSLTIPSARDLFRCSGILVDRDLCVS